MPRPSLDGDFDGIADAADRCVEQAEDLDGFADGDGCPDLDDDDDAIADDHDECPAAREDADGFEDGDGCPDEDDDRDRILDAADRCPRDAEAYNGYLDDDGCPDSAIVLVDGDRIVVVTHIRFVRGRTAVAPDDVSLVDDLVNALAQHPELRLIALRARLAPDDPAQLGERRVRALVRRLVAAGIDPERLEAAPVEPARPEDAASEPTVELTVLDPVR